MSFKFVQAQEMQLPKGVAFTLTHACAATVTGETAGGKQVQKEISTTTNPQEISEL